jgi:hypothetical protein
MSEAEHPTLTAYDEDFCAWAARQAELLRTGRLEEADIEHIAEEVEDLGKSEKHKLESLLGTVIEHLMKLQASPATNPREGWRRTIRRTRREIEIITADSPSLARLIPEMVRRQLEKVRRDVADELKDRGEDLSALAGLTYSKDQVLGPWLP